MTASEHFSMGMPVDRDGHVTLETFLEPIRLEARAANTLVTTALWRPHGPQPITHVALASYYGYDAQAGVYDLVPNGRAPKNLLLLGSPFVSPLPDGSHISPSAEGQVTWQELERALEQYRSKLGGRVPVAVWGAPPADATHPPNGAMLVVVDPA